MKSTRCQLMTVLLLAGLLLFSMQTAGFAAKAPAPAPVAPPTAAAPTTIVPIEYPK